MKEPRATLSPDPPTARSIVAGYLVVAGVVLLLWAASDPLAGTVALVVAGVTLVAVRRAARLVRCLRVCGGFTLDLAGGLRVTVSRADGAAVAPCGTGGR